MKTFETILKIIFVQFSFKAKTLNPTFSINILAALISVFREMGNDKIRYDRCVGVFEMTFTYTCSGCHESDEFSRAAGYGQSMSESTHGPKVNQTELPLGADH